MSSKVEDLIKEINTDLKQCSSSRKDEITIMRAMLNDTSYKIDIYDKNGKIETYCPAEDFKSMITSIISSAVKINKDEASAIMEDYSVSRPQARTMVNISKEFVNTYVDTGRKLPFGGRETSNYAIAKKDIKATTKMYPKKIGTNPDGTANHELYPKHVPAYSTIRSYGSCPSWLNSEDE